MFEFIDDAMDVPELLVSLEEAGLEESGHQPIAGFGDRNYSGSVMEYLDWFHDGESPDYEN